MPRAANVALLALLTLLPLSGCYAGRALWGGLEILAQRRPVERVLADPATDPALARRLRTVQELRRFAAGSLGLPDRGSYRSWVELDREHAAWTVTAAPELSIEPLVWCFPVAGCVSYRGYFSERRARRFADRLRRRGLDVDVGGVDAYSTLGWFDDPVLSTFIDYPEAELAGLLFHELAHQRLYVKNDTTFNESFATVVERVGVDRWLAATGRHAEASEAGSSRRREERFLALVLRYRGLLAEAYAAPADDTWKRRRKAELLDELRAEFHRLRADEPGWERYESWFGAGLNNARLATIGAYHELAPALGDLLGRLGGDLERFYRALEDLRGLTPEVRRSRLATAGGSPEGRAGAGPDHPG